jgi:hypothetical protein
VWQVGVGLPTEQANSSWPSVNPADGRGTRCKSWENEGFWPMSQRNDLDNSEVWPPNGRQLPARTSEGGWFPDERSCSPQTQTHLPCDGTSCGFDFGGWSCAVPAIVSQFEYPRLALVVPRQCMPRLQERPNLQLVGPANSAGPMQSGGECCKKSISTFVVVAVASAESGLEGALPLC